MFLFSTLPEQIKSQEENLKRYRKLLKKYQGIEINIPGVSSSGYGAYEVLSFTYSPEWKEKLSEIRKALRESLGSWEDTLLGVSHSYGTVCCVTWQGKITGMGETINIQMFHPDMYNLPEGLLKPTCKWVNAVNEYKVLKCEVSNGNH